MQYHSPTNVTLIRAGNELILVDMGSGDRFMPSAGKLWDNLKSAGIDKAKEIYLVADQKLGARDWVLDTYSVADIHLFRLFWRFLGFAKPDLADYPHLAAHYARMMERPAVKRTIEIESAQGYEFPQ